MEKVTFNTNVPVELALRYTQGKRVESKFGGEQHMFTSDKGTFYVAGVVGDILEKQLIEQNVQPGDLITICKREVPNGAGRKSVRWQVSRPVIGEQADGTLVIPKAPETDLERELKASIEHVAQKKANGKPAPEPKPEAKPAGWAQYLLQQTNTLVDVFAAALRHAGENHGAAVKAEDVRSLVVTAFIQQAKGGAYGDR